jgi:hypothetical protein
VLVENGLALLFRWRPYLAYFDARATNALVAFAIAFSFVRFFELDIVTTLVHAYRPDVENTGMSWVGSALTAAIIAGGSTAVNRVFQQLGFRPTGSEPPPVPRPPRTEAWISVALVRKKAVGPVFVSIQAPGEAPAFAGTIDGPGRRLSSWLRRTFTRNRSRYPQSGGHSVRLDVPLEIAVSGVDSDGNPLRQAWGPHAVAAGALLDLELSI